MKMNLSDTIKNLKEALAISPENFLIRKMLLENLFSAGFYNEAESEGLSILSKHDDDLIKIILAKCYYNNNKISASLVILEDLSEKQSSNTDFLLFYSKVLFDTKSYDLSLSNYNKAISISPELKNIEFENELKKHTKPQKIKTSIGLEEIDADGSNFLIENLIKPSIDFSYVGGMEKVKNEISLKIILPLKNPEIYKAYKKAVGGGILLYGPPGCGKTLIARATAGEVNANFISVGINEILNMYLGESEKNLHSIFDLARRNTPCVLFFDEVDALGANRNDLKQNWFKTIINQFLDELDGVKYSNEGILILAATNAPWHMDSAFKRPGRFDRQIFVAPPDYEARKRIFEIYLSDKPHEKIDFENLAKNTNRYSGADIKSTVDIAIEGKILEAMSKGIAIPINNSDLKSVISKYKPTTSEWMNSAENYAKYSNDSGQYDGILEYLNKI
jgi:SpoVK/Ycf46/Vps4 family AAA+-type ATPase